jgi:hypothetical protein
VLAVLVLCEAPLLPHVAGGVHLDAPLVWARPHLAHKVPVDGVVADADGGRVARAGWVGRDDGVAAEGVAAGEQAQLLVGHCVEGAVAAEVGAFWDAHVNEESRCLEIEDALRVGVLRWSLATLDKRGTKEEESGSHYRVMPSSNENLTGPSPGNKI